MTPTIPEIQKVYVRVITEMQTVDGLVPVKPFLDIIGYDSYLGRVLRIFIEVEREQKSVQYIQGEKIRKWLALFDKGFPHTIKGRKEQPSFRDENDQKWIFVCPLCGMEISDGICNGYCGFIWEYEDNSRKSPVGTAPLWLTDKDAYIARESERKRMELERIETEYQKTLEDAKMSRDKRIQATEEEWGPRQNLLDIKVEDMGLGAPSALSPAQKAWITRKHKTEVAKVNHEN